MQKRKSETATKGIILWLLLDNFSVFAYNEIRKRVVLEVVKRRHPGK